MKGLLMDPRVHFYQKDDKLIVLSGCCDNRILWNYPSTLTGRSDATCVECGNKVLSLELSITTELPVTTDEDTLQYWVHRWTDIELVDIKITKTYE